MSHVEPDPPELARPLGDAAALLLVGGASVGAAATCGASAIVLGVAATIADRVQALPFATPGTMAATLLAALWGAYLLLVVLGFRLARTTHGRCRLGARGFALDLAASPLTLEVRHEAVTGWRVTRLGVQVSATEHRVRGAPRRRGWLQELLAPLFVPCRSPEERVRVEAWLREGALAGSPATPSSERTTRPLAAEPTAEAAEVPEVPTSPPEPRA